MSQELTPHLIRQAAERLAIRHLLTVAQEQGWTVYLISDGEEVFRDPTRALVLDTVFSVDESQIQFKKPIPWDPTKFYRATVCIVLGNSGNECISDYGGSVFINEVMNTVNKFTDALEA